MPKKGIPTATTPTEKPLTLAEKLPPQSLHPALPRPAPRSWYPPEYVERMVAMPDFAAVKDYTTQLLAEGTAQALVPFGGSGRAGPGPSRRPPCGPPHGPLLALMAAAGAAAPVAGPAEPRYYCVPMRQSLLLGQRTPLLPALGNAVRAPRRQRAKLCTLRRAPPGSLSPPAHSKARTDTSRTSTCPPPPAPPWRAVLCCAALQTASRSCTA